MGLGGVVGALGVDGGVLQGRRERGPAGWRTGDALNLGGAVGGPPRGIGPPTSPQPHPTSQIPPPTSSPPSPPAPQEQSLQVRCEEDLGPLLLLLLHKQKLFLEDAWFCAAIAITAPDGALYCFPCYQWLEGTTTVEVREGAGKTSCHLHPNLYLLVEVVQPSPHFLLFFSRAQSGR